MSSSFSKEEAEALQARVQGKERKKVILIFLLWSKNWQYFIYCIEWYVTLCLFLTGHQMRTTSQYNPCHVICSCLVLISHMKLAVQEFCISPQSAMPHSKSRSYVWTLFKASMTLLLFHRFPQFLAADPTVLSVPEGGRQRYPLSISSYSLHADTPKDNPITLQHHEQNRGGRRRGAPPFSIDLLVF